MKIVTSSGFPIQRTGWWEVCACWVCCGIEIWLDHYHDKHSSETVSSNTTCPTCMNTLQLPQNIILILTSQYTCLVTLPFNLPTVCLPHVLRNHKLTDFLDHAYGVSTTSLIALLLVDSLVLPTPYTTSKNYIVCYFELLCNQSVFKWCKLVCVLV